MRGGTGIFTGRPAYVWISNQIGNTGVLTGFEQLDNTTTRARSTRIRTATSRPTSPARRRASYELALTDPDFKFPQVWRTNIAVDQRLPWGMVGTAEYIYNRTSTASTTSTPTCRRADSALHRRRRAAALDATNRINSNVANAVVLKNQDVGTSWNLAGSLDEDASRRGFC